MANPSRRTWDDTSFSRNSDRKMATPLCPDLILEERWHQSRTLTRLVLTNWAGRQLRALPWSRHSTSQIFFLKPARSAFGSMNFLLLISVVYPISRVPG